MKTKSIFWVMMIVIILAPTFVVAEKCDSAELAKKFQSWSNLPIYRKSDSANLYNYQNLPDTLKFFYRENNIGTYSFQFRSDTKILNIDKEILELVFIYGQDKGKKSYLFINGEEIRKLFPEITEDYFRVKISDEEMIFYFENKNKEGKLIITYALLKIKNKVFCRQQKSLKT